MDAEIDNKSNIMKVKSDFGFGMNCFVIMYKGAPLKTEVSSDSGLFIIELYGNSIDVEKCLKIIKSSSKEEESEHLSVYKCMLIWDLIE